MIRRIIAFTLTVILVTSSIGFSFAMENLEQQVSGLAEIYERNTDEYDVFTNYADGYSMAVDKGMTVDMTYPEVGAFLEKDTKRIEIYKQSVVGASASSYINYSNKFLDNQISHNLLYNGSAEIGNKNVTVTMWSRNSLELVENDMNYYVCIEIPLGSYVYSVFVKSTEPFYGIGDYAYLVEEFTIFTPTATAKNKVTEAVDIETRGWNEETEEFYKEYFIDSNTTEWGIFEPETAQFSYGRLGEYEKYFGHEFPVILNYSSFDNYTKHSNLKQRLDIAWEHGKVLELTLQTNRADHNQIYQILEGNYDSFLKDYAKTVAQFGHPVIFRLFNEMNGDWCPYSAYNTSKDTKLFRDAYIYIYNIFEKAGATKNTIWVWNPNEGSFPNFKWNDMMMYYPGDKYTDVIGLTAYNTGTYYSYIGEKWTEFETLYDEIYYDYDKKFKQPFMITEFASASMGGDKAEWITEMFKVMGKYDRIKMAIWWDGCDWDSQGNVARSYILDETPDIMDAFREGITNWRKTRWLSEIYV